MKRGGRLRRMSPKRRALLPERRALLERLYTLAGDRCEYCRRPTCQPLDGHEVRKPRARYWLDPEYVVILGRPHHDMAEAAFGTGRLVITGTRSTGWGMYVDTKAAKWV